MKWINQYFEMHIQNWREWYLVVFSIVLGVLATILSISTFISAINGNPIINYILSSLSVAVIGSIPLIRVNKKIVIKNQFINKTRAILLYQGITIIILSLISSIILYFLIIDFRI